MTLTPQEHALPEWPGSGAELPLMLAPLDGSTAAEQVLPLVSVLAKALGSRVALLRVLETDLLPTTLDAPQQVLIDRLVEDAKQASLAYLGGLQTRLQVEGIEATVDILPGAPAEAITFLAHSQGVDLIAMCTHGRSGLDLWLTGSVADKVLRTADCPVLLVRARRAESPALVTPTRVLAPLDGSGLAERALPIAAAVTARLGAPLHLARAVTLPVLAIANSDPATDVDVEGELLGVLEEQAREYLASQAAALDARGLRVETHLLRGEPAAALLALAGDDPGTLTVMATHGRSGPARYLLGSVTDRMVRSAAGPVLAVP